MLQNASGRQTAHRAHSREDSIMHGVHKRNNIENRRWLLGSVSSVHFGAFALGSLEQLLVTCEVAVVHGCNRGCQHHALDNVLVLDHAVEQVGCSLQYTETGSPSWRRGCADARAGLPHLLVHNPSRLV